MTEKGGGPVHHRRPALEGIFAIIYLCILELFPCVGHHSQYFLYMNSFKPDKPLRYHFIVEKTEAQGHTAGQRQSQGSNPTISQMSSDHQALWAWAGVLSPLRR